MRLVCFGDVHMTFRAVERLGPVLAGDITNFTNFGDPPDTFHVVDAVRAHCAAVLAVTGNLDFVSAHDGGQLRV